ncbi:hypothetical protein [Maribacter sp. 2307UL18-2]|uniref:hypothetical protein n=1 Tax=Maribacter sp. 2307UL18-2 TaxID=3386274 RepID=UPI0039BC9AC6
MAIIALSSLPYIHDTITVRGEGIKGWVPDFGLQSLLMDQDGYVLGFSSYRVFIYTFLIHLFAHLGWVGWFFEAIHKLYRPFLLVPVTLSLYQIIIILSNSRTTVFNEPDIKFLLTMGLSIAAALNFYFNNRETLNRHFLNK